MPNINPLRTINQYDIVPFFSFSGASANKGTFVSALGSGLNFDSELTLSNLSSVAGTFSSQFDVPGSSLLPLPALRSLPVSECSRRTFAQLTKMAIL